MARPFLACFTAAAALTLSLPAFADPPKPAATGATGAKKPKPRDPSPSEAADPAPIPAPSTTASAPTSPATASASGTAQAGIPTSTSGTLIMPPPDAAASAPPVSAPVVAAPVVAPAPSIDVDASHKALEERILATEARMQALEDRVGYLKYFNVRGYIQPQLLIQSYNSEASPNIINGKLPVGVSANAITAKADGTTTNGTFFRLRRTRLITELTPSDYVRLVFEFDPNLSGTAVSGTGTIARNIEAVGIAKLMPSLVAEFGMGIFKLPFGFEVPQSDADRPFIERSWGEQNMFPGEFDTGARVKVTALESKKLQVHAAIVNGVTIGEKTFALLPDLNRGKDGVARVNYDFGPADVGVSGYYGTGQNVDATALAFKQFIRGAGNFEAAFHAVILPQIGMTKAFGEITYGQNMDRGVKYAFALPQIQTNINQSASCGNRTGSDCDELSGFIRIEQDITHWVTAGARWDAYTPDLTLSSNTRNTFGFLGVFHFTRNLQLMAEYDYAEDNIHKQGGASAGKYINTGSFVFQARSF